MRLIDRIFAVTALSLALIACGGGNTQTRDEVPPECREIKAFEELAANLTMALRIIEANVTDPDQAVAELNAYADERTPTTTCLRAVMPALNEQMKSNRPLLREYGRKLGPPFQKKQELEKTHPEVFKHPGIDTALRRLL